MGCTMGNPWWTSDGIAHLIAYYLWEIPWDVPWDVPWDDPCKFSCYDMLTIWDDPWDVPYDDPIDHPMGRPTCCARSTCRPIVRPMGDCVVWDNPWYVPWDGSWDCILMGCPVECIASYGMAHWTANGLVSYANHRSFNRPSHGMFHGHGMSHGYHVTWEYHGSSHKSSHGISYEMEFDLYPIPRDVPWVVCHPMEVSWVVP